VTDLGPARTASSGRPARDQKGGAVHTATMDVRLGDFRATASIDIGTRGLLAVSALVGVVLAGAAAIVWVATGPARRRAGRRK
jgi:hypothetical protein